MAARALRALARSICRRPALYFYPQLALFVLGVLITVGVRDEWMQHPDQAGPVFRFFHRAMPGLQFDVDRDNLVGSDKKYHKNFLGFKKEFPQQDDIVVVVESEDMEKNRQFVERLGRRLEAETNIFTDVFYKGDLKMLGSKALLFVPENELEELKKTLTEFRPFIKQFTQATNFDSLFSLVNTQFRTAKQEENEENKSMVKALPALERIVREGTSALQHPGIAPSPGLDALFGAGDEAEQKLYITFDKGRIYLVTAHAKDQDSNGEAVEKMRELVGQTKLEAQGLNVGLTGEPILEYDEMAQSQHDSTIASIVSLVLCAGIFIYGYRETGRPIKATFCLLIGLGYTMGFTTLVIGHLNILTITFVPILIGLAIDFGVHLITRFEEELRHGRDKESAMEKAIVYTGQGIITGALTTGGAFLAMGVTSFKGIQEMGIICGAGMLLCLVPMMTMLPVLLMRGRQNVLDAHHAHVHERRARIEEIWLRRPLTVTALTAGLCILAAIRLDRVYFDYNLLNMQSKGLPAVIYEKKLINSADKSVLFGASVAGSVDEALELEKKFKKLPSVNEVESMAPYLSGDQRKKLSMVGEVKREVADIHFPPEDPNPVDIPGLSRTLWFLQGYLGLAYDEVIKDDASLAAQLQSLRDAIGEFRKAMLRDDPNVQPRLRHFQSALLSDIRTTFDTIRNQDNSSALQPGDLPPALRNRFIGVTRKQLIQVYPKEDVWQRAPQERFVRELRSVDPDVTGTPVQLYEYTTLLKESYQQAAIYALIAIAIMVFIHFRSLVCVVLALVPVGIGSLWMTGIMGWSGLPFNPANIMTLPLVIGIGVTNGIHILNRFAEERHPGVLARSTGKAVLISGLMTISGFGSLILGKHQGINSLGLVMSVGITTCMIAGLTILPALLSLIIRSGWMIKKSQ